MCENTTEAPYRLMCSSSPHVFISLSELKGNVFFSCTDQKLNRGSAAVLNPEEQYAQNQQEEGTGSSSGFCLLMSED